MRRPLGAFAQGIVDDLHHFFIGDGARAAAAGFVLQASHAESLKPGTPFVACPIGDSQLLGYGHVGQTIGTTQNDL